MLSSPSRFSRRGLFLLFGLRLPRLLCCWPVLVLWSSAHSLSLPLSHHPSVSAGEDCSRNLWLKCCLSQSLPISSCVPLVCYIIVLDAVNDLLTDRLTDGLLDHDSCAWSFVFLGILQIMV